MTPIQTVNHRRSADSMAAPGCESPPAGIEEELRKIKLDNEDFRFERDRYKASAAQFQSKLVQALSELDELRILREEVPHLRQQVVEIAQEFEARRASDNTGRAEKETQIRQVLHEEFRNYYHEQLEQERARLSAQLGDEYANRLRQEVISLVTEFETKLAGETAANERSYAPVNHPDTDGDRPLTMFRKIFGKL